MNSRKHRKLTRHPFVRLIRAIFRLLRVIFKPKQGISTTHLHKNLIDDSSLNTAVNIEVNNLDSSREMFQQRERLITVGELLGQVKWQSPPENIPEKVSSPNRVSRTRDVSLN